MSAYCRVLCPFTLMLALAITASAQESDAAIVQASGSAWLNGALLPGISAIFPGDFVQTKDDSAGIEPAGSLVVVAKESLVKYEGRGSVELKRGGVSVNTSKKLLAHIANLKVQPSTEGWVKFEVAAIGDSARIVAIQGDVSVTDERGTAVLQAGRETTVPVEKKRRKKAGGAIPGAKGSVLDTVPAMIVGGAAIGGITEWVLLHREDPISPDKP